VAIVTEVAREGSLEERIALAARVLQASLQLNSRADSEADLAAAAAATAADCLSWELRARVLLEVCAALKFLHGNGVRSFFCSFFRPFVLGQL